MRWALSNFWMHLDKLFLCRYLIRLLRLLFEGESTLLTVHAKIRGGNVNIPVPLRQRYKMWEGTVMELVLLEDGILLKPLIEKRGRNEMIDKYVPRTQIVESEIVALVSELTSHPNNELIIEEKCPR